VEMLRIWYTEDQLKALLEGPAQNCGLEVAYLKQALALLKTQEMEPTVRAVLKDLKAASGTSAKQPLLREFVGLTTKNSLIRQMQSVLRLCKRELFSIEELSNDQILRSVADVTALATEFPVLLTKKKDAYPLLLMLFGASAYVFQYQPHCSRPLMEALILAVEKFPAAGAMAIIHAKKPTSLNFNNWMDALLNAHPKGEASREVESLLKRLLRIFTAWKEFIASNNDAALLQLPKEERLLLQDLIKARSDTAKK